jgi:cell division protein FtsW
MKKIKLKKQKKEFDRVLFYLAIVLTVFGLIAVTDASAPSAVRTFSDKFYFAKQQALWAVIGSIALIVLTRLHYSFWEKYATYLFFGTVALLILVLIPGLSSKVLGARRWLVIGPVNVQPSEIIKLTLAMYIAKVAASNMKIAAFFFPVIIVATLIMFQPDLGTTIAVVGIAAAQIFVSGINLFYFVAAVVTAGMAGLILILSSDYRRDRLLTYFKQAQDPLGKAYHIRQVLFALGLGGFWGVGLGESRQKYLFLPEAATDSIFAVIAEEVGFVGGLIIILLFLYFIYRGLKIAQNAPDTFSKVLATGIVAWIGGQAFLNIAAMVAIVPLTGIPLPFFSYGGSALLSVMAGTGILLNISKYG